MAVADFFFRGMDWAEEVAVLGKNMIHGFATWLSVRRMYLLQLRLSDFKRV
jgi:hypothetical protein